MEHKSNTVESGINSILHRAVAAEDTTVKDMILRLVEAHLAELEKKGLLPKGK